MAAVCEAVLGDGYQIVEIGFDVPFPGAVDQPWHRDFPSPVATHRDRRLTSLAFNVTTVDTTPDMGPFQIAPGTQYEAGLDWDHQMFPPRSQWSRFEEHSQLRMPQRGDISSRSALTVHRGTANVGSTAPPRGHPGSRRRRRARRTARHDRHPAVLGRPRPPLRRHLRARVVDELQPLVQKHTIEGLVMGAS